MENSRPQEVMGTGERNHLFGLEFFQSALKDLAAEYAKEDPENLPPRVVLYLANGNTVAVKKIRSLESDRMLVQGIDVNGTFWTLIAYQSITQVVLDSVETDHRIEME